MNPRRSLFRFRRRLRGLRPRPLRQIAVLPTLITLGNGVCGLLSVLAAFEGRFGHAASLIFFAMVFDALDGQVARATRTTSAFGAQLDSLCDVISFGLAPAVLAALLARQPNLSCFPERMVTVAACFYFSGAALRLARFNVETTEDLQSHMTFSGLPSPAAAGVVAGTVVWWSDSPRNAYVEFVVPFLPAALLVLGLMMVSRVRFSHVLNQLFHGLHPFVRIVEIGLAATLLVLFRETALMLAFVGYAASGPLDLARSLLRRPGPTPAPAPDEGPLPP